LLVVRLGRQCSIANQDCQSCERSREKAGLSLWTQECQGRLLAYADCCGRYIDHWDARPAPDAEALMRSRYTAFVSENQEYLQATWHASQRPSQLDFDAATKWLGLDVKQFQPTGDASAEVEFVARYRLAGRAVRLHERSRFVLEGGRWFYVDGDQF
jgi:SEC-C motif-containing protein